MRMGNGAIKSSSIIPFGDEGGSSGSSGVIMVMERLYGVIDKPIKSAVSMHTPPGPVQTPQQ